MVEYFFLLSRQMGWDESEGSRLNDFVRIVELLERV
jgi:hypothetical protein